MIIFIVSKRLTLDNHAITPNRIRKGAQLYSPGFVDYNENIDINTPNVLRERPSMFSEESTESMPFISAATLNRQFLECSIRQRYSPEKDEDLYENTLSRPSSDIMPVISSKAAQAFAQ